MESINPEENPTLSLKRRYDKSITIRLDEDLLEELNVVMESNKYTYNSISHYARCAIIEKLRGKKENE